MKIEIRGGYAEKVKRTILPVISWKQCYICNRAFRYIRMYQIDPSSFYEKRVYICSSCASDINEAQRKYNEARKKKAGD